MDDKYLEAKKLYAKYNYSTSTMGRDSFNNDFKKYMEYNVPKELQLEWAHEYQEELLKNIYSAKTNRYILDNFIKFSIAMDNNLEYANLARVIKLIHHIENKLDSFTKERIAGILLRYVIGVYIRKNIEYDKEVTELEQIVVNWLNEIIEGPIHVDQSYYVNDGEKGAGFLVELFEPEEIKRGARNAISEWERNKDEFKRK